MLNIQLERRYGSFKRKDKRIICKDSAKNNRGPNIFLKTLSLRAHMTHFALSEGSKFFIIKGSSFNKTFLPEQYSTNLITVWYG